MSKYTEAEKKQLLADVLDPDRIVLICEKHFYVGEGPPTQGCSGCWEVFFVQLIARTPPHLRDEQLDRLDSLIHHLVEAENSGGSQISLYKRPKISIERQPD